MRFKLLPGEDAVKDHARVWESAWLGDLGNHTASVGRIGRTQLGVHDILSSQVSFDPV